MTLPLNREHLHCTMIMRERDPHVGLYCQQHNKWISWLNHYEVQLAVELGIQVEGPVVMRDDLFRLTDPEGWAEKERRWAEILRQHEQQNYYNIEE